MEIILEEYQKLKHILEEECDNLEETWKCELSIKYQKLINDEIEAVCEQMRLLYKIIK